MHPPPVTVELLKLANRDQKLHYSHLYPYVSAYEATARGLDEFRRMLMESLRIAAEIRQVQYVSLDGEMFIECTPTGRVNLCLRWREYEVWTPEDDSLLRASRARIAQNLGLDRQEVHGPYCAEFETVKRPSGVVWSEGTPMQMQVYCSKMIGHEGSHRFDRAIGDLP